MSRPYKRYGVQSCPPDCQCGKHNGNQKCKPGCECGRHSFKGNARTDKPLGRGQHYRIYSVRGKANEYNCYGCGQQAKQWANIHDTNRQDVQNYEALCHRCHIIYDRSGCSLQDIKNETFRNKTISRIMRGMGSKGR